jgi:hypothetical protein
MQVELQNRVIANLVEQINTLRAENAILAKPDQTATKTSAPAAKRERGK